MNSSGSRLGSAAAITVAVSLLLGGCVAGGSPSSSAAGSSGSPEEASPSPGVGGSSPSASATGQIASVATPDAAARLVLASDPRFDGIGPRNPTLIGQGSWYEATAAPGGGFQVVVRVGWGDCQAGCIDEHRWTFEVSALGAIRLLRETGAPVPSDLAAGTVSPPTIEPSPRATPAPIASAGSGGSGSGSGSSGSTGATTIEVKGRATAGPVCPVERIPPDPQCAPRPVASAVLDVMRGNSRVTTVTTDSNGDFAVLLGAGDYTLVPHPVTGLMGTPAPIPFTVPASGSSPFIDVQYDTGIR